MLRNKTIILLISISLFSTWSHATKPCSSDSYFSNSNRTMKEWMDASDWTVKVRIIKINHKWVPYENCYIEDRTKCNQRDDGNFESEVLGIIKGNLLSEQIKLKPSYCSKELPDKLGIYIFYGSKDRGYYGYELIENVNQSDLE